jgi:hypothetical protein
MHFVCVWYAPANMNTDLTTERTLSLFGFAFASIGVGAILYFWVMAAILDATNNGGLIVQMNLEGLWRTAFLSYPIVAIVALIVGAILWFAGRDKEAVGIAGLPIALTVGYYLLLTLVPRF